MKDSQLGGVVRQCVCLVGWGGDTSRTTHPKRESAKRTRSPRRRLVVVHSFLLRARSLINTRPSVN